MVWLLRGSDGVREREEACLRTLCSGADSWEEFYDVFGLTLTFEMSRFDLKRAAEREDLLQDVVLRLISNDFHIIRSFLERNTGYSFRAVLRTVVHSAFIDGYRGRKRFHRFAQPEYAPALSEVAESEWADDPARRLYRAVRLECALSEVTRGASSDEAFRILYLRFVEDWAVKAIARELKLPENTVSQRIRYYLPRMRQVIRRRGFGHGD